MISIHKSGERGTTRTNWLLSRHSLSFGNYYNPKRMNFGLLRVFNDDIIKPGTGFGMHHHDNMEVVSIVLKGALEHKDSAGNHRVIKEGEVQKMSAGTGIYHSEFNPSEKEDGHFLQIWIEPKENGIKPSYEQKRIPESRNKFQTIASGSRKEDGVYIHQDAEMLIGNFDKGKEISQRLKNTKGIFVFVIDGKIKLGNDILEPGDCAEIMQQDKISFRPQEQSKILIVSVPMDK